MSARDAISPSRLAAANGKATAPLRRPWGRRVLLAALALIALLAAAFSYITSDGFVKARLLAIANDELNGEVSAESVSLAIFQGLEVRGLRIAAPPTMQGPGKVMLTAPVVRCDFNPWSLLSGPLELKRLVFEKPLIRVERYDDGKVNFELLVAKEREPGKPPRLRLFTEGVTLRSATASYEDHATFKDETPRLVEDLNVWLRPRSDSLSAFEFEGGIGRPPLRGVTVQGWLAKREGQRGVEFHLAVDAPGLDLKEMAARALPADLAAVLVKMEASGTVWGDFTLNVVTGSRADILANVSLAEGHLRPPAVPVAIDSLAINLRLDGRRLQSGPWVGRVSTGAGQGAFLVRAPPGEPATFWAYTSVNQADLGLMGKRLGGEFAKMHGVMDLDAELEGVLLDPKSYKGTVTCSVVDAYLAELPLFVGYFNVLSLTLPSKPVFDRGHLRGRFRNGAVHVDEALLSSIALDVTGKGTIGLDGQLNLVMVTSRSDRPSEEWLPVRLIKQVFTAVIGGLQQTILPPVHVTGNIRKPEYKPMTLEPLKRPLRVFTDVLQLLPFTGGAAPAPE